LLAQFWGKQIRQRESDDEPDAKRVEHVIGKEDCDKKTNPE